ncbi:MAG: DUF302 domain-containing protein [Deltaproteobacteria bacterium]|jgi:uncharacterized protein (DUF302 family)|nr:DUF302 domain-containing protein [Deltaproteobacteria bacterium]
MQKDQVYATTSEKSASEFAKSLGGVARKNGFVIHNESSMDMAYSFGQHGAEVAEGFDLHMIQICKPEKAAKSLNGNPERAILMPKFIMTFSKDGKTQIRFLSYSEENIRAVVDDDIFPGSLAQTYAKIHEMIEEAR